MPNYKGRKPGTRRVVIWVQGRPIERIVQGTKKEAEAFEARLRVELEVAAPTTRTAPTFGVFSSDVYEPHAKRHLRESTWKKVRAYQVATLVQHLGALKLTDITTEAIETYKRERRGNAPGVNNELRVLRTMLRFARELGYPCATPKIIKLPVKGKPRVKVWTSEQMARFYAAARAEAPELLPMLIFLANTGCRKGEALAAEWDWIDERRSLISIPVSEVWRPKSNRPREVPNSPAVRAALAGTRRHEQFLFPTRHGTQYASFPEDLFRRAKRAAGLSGGPHTLRHTYASHFLQAVPDMKLLAEILGHSTTRVTELYSHLLPGHLARAMDAVSLLPTMADTMATASGTGRSPAKTKKRH